MIVIKCPKCGGCFSVAGPPAPLFVDCPACHKTLRLRARSGEDLFQPGGRGSDGRWRRHAPRVVKWAGILLGVAALAVVGFFTVPGLFRSGPNVAGPPTTQPRPGPGQQGTTAYQAQLELAERRGSSVKRNADDLLRIVSPAVVRVIVQGAGRQSVGQGLGFLVSPNGWIVTSYHVIEGADTATVVLSDADHTDLLVEGVAAVDRPGDLALLKVNGRDIPCLLISTKDPPGVGTEVFAVGVPAGLKNTLSKGWIGGHREQKGLTFLETTARVSRGSRGAPLLAADGVVLGVNHRVAGAGEKFHLAVPARRVLDLLRKQGKLVPLEKLQVEPRKESVVVQLRRAWDAMGKKDWDAAEKMLKSLASAHPDNAFVFFALGHLRRENGSYKLAIEAFETAVRLKSDYAEAHYNIGLTCCDLKALATSVEDHARVADLENRAKEAFLKAISFDPTGKVGQNARVARAKYWPKEFRK